MSVRARLAVLAIAIAIAGSGCGSGNEPVAAPNVTGLGRAAAERLLDDRGLRWRYAGDAAVRDRPIPASLPFPDDEPRTGADRVLPSPEVVGQSPPAGSALHAGDVVTLELRGGTARLLEQLRRAQP